MNWYIQAIKRYADFNGRARRTEYWIFVLFNTIFGAVAGLVDGVLGIALISSLYSLFVLIPNLSISFRRLHDVDKSAWWLLISFVPVVGVIVLLVFSVMPGTVGANRYGQDPKAEY